MEIVAFSEWWPMAGFVKMHSDSSWRGAENYRVHTFKILGFLRGRKCKRGAHASSEKGSQSSVAIHGQKKKIQVGMIQLHVSLFTLSRKKGFVWFRVLMRWDKENQDMSRDIKNELLYQTSLECTRCPWMHVNVWRLIVHNKRMYSHLYRGVGRICFLMKKAPPFSSFSLHTVLLASTYTCQKYASVADGRYIYTYIYVHSYIQYILLGSTADIWKGGSHRQWWQVWQRYQNMWGNEDETGIFRTPSRGARWTSARQRDETW